MFIRRLFFMIGIDIFCVYWYGFVVHIFERKCIITSRLFIPDVGSWIEQNKSVYKNKK